LARRREAERLALLRLLDLREREDLRLLFRAELRPPRLAAFLRADPRALFLAPLRADFRPDFRAPFLADRLADFLRDLVGVPLVPPVRLLGVGSSKSNDDGDDAGEGEGVLSEGRGSIHPEPDQPISI
jgi:hypothetical protein